MCEWMDRNLDRPQEETETSGLLAVEAATHPCRRSRTVDLHERGRSGSRLKSTGQETVIGCSSLHVIPCRACP